MINVESILAALRKMRVIGTPVFGADTAALAKREGVLFGHQGYGGGATPATAAEEQNAKLNQLLRWLHPGSYARTTDLLEHGDFRGVGLNTSTLIGEHHPKRIKTVGRISADGFANKAEEAAALKGMEPKTMRVRDALKAVGHKPGAKLNTDAFTDHLRKELGPTYIFKPEAGAASKGGLTTEASKDLPRDFANHIVQTRIPMKQTSGFERFVDALYAERTANAKKPLLQSVRDAWKARANVGQVAGASSTTGKGTVEYRVHAVAGRVIPYSAIRRGSGIGTMNPWHTREMTRVEQHVQGLLDKVPEQHRRNTYGFDVGIGAKDSKPFVIEANPSTDDSFTSGFMGHPFTADALVAATKGQLPRRILAQRALQGTAVGLPVAGLAHHYTASKEAGTMDMDYYRAGFDARIKQSSETNRDRALTGNIVGGATGLGAGAVIGNRMGTAHGMMQELASGGKLHGRMEVLATLGAALGMLIGTPVGAAVGGSVQRTLRK